MIIQNVPTPIFISKLCINYLHRRLLLRYTAVTGYCMCVVKLENSYRFGFSGVQIKDVGCS